MRIRQTPVAVAAGGLRRGIVHRVFPGHLARVGLLPHQAGHIVRDRAVAIVGEGLRIRRRSRRVVAVFAKRRRRADRLARVRHLHL